MGFIVGRIVGPKQAECHGEFRGDSPEILRVAEVVPAEIVDVGPVTELAAGADAKQKIGHGISAGPESGLIGIDAIEAQRTPAVGANELVVEPLVSHPEAEFKGVGSTDGSIAVGEFVLHKRLRCSPAAADRREAGNRKNGQPTGGRPGVRKGQDAVLRVQILIGLEIRDASGGPQITHAKIVQVGGAENVRPGHIARSLPKVGSSTRAPIPHSVCGKA